MKTIPDISVVIPLFNEEESLPELSSWVKKILTENNFKYEIIFVDDGSNDNSWKVIEGIQSSDPNVKAIKFRRNYGKSAALNTGFEAASGNVVITMDADMQDSPDEIPALYKMIAEEKFDLVSGWKKKRHDPLSKTIPSKFFNWTTRKMSGINNLHDFNCGLKAYRSEVIKNIEIYGEMHRYIPVIANWAGFKKIGEKEVAHRARKFGKTKFGLDRFMKGFLDLVSISFVTRFGKRPMHLFGFLGTFMFVLGFFGAAYLGASKLYVVYHNLSARLLTDRPSFYISLTCMIIGTLLFIAGFIGELVSRNSGNRNDYQVEKKLNLD
ncbi:MAG: glycosyltransferase family 2 protein [Bacteroidia bacterium]